MNQVFPVIVCIAKKESDYIEEFVKYHLALGFKYIYLYDNEDEPTYEKLLEKYKDFINVIHYPGNHYDTGIQYKALEHFRHFFINNNEITHIAHIDIDEFIVLKKHKNICDFINEYIVGDCQGIGINWRFFGSSGHEEKKNIPVTIRFTMCAKDGNKHIKTLFKKEKFRCFVTCHQALLYEGHIKSTNGEIIPGPFNYNIDFSVIQLNHYKCKTFQEYKYIRTRGRADFSSNRQGIFEDIDEITGTFNESNINEIEELAASKFYTNLLKKDVQEDIDSIFRLLHYQP